MTWPDAVVFLVLGISTLNRLNRLEQAANLIPGRWQR